MIRAHQSAIQADAQRNIMFLGGLFFFSVHYFNQTNGAVVPDHMSFGIEQARLLICPVSFTVDIAKI
jgi:hypothetical protein